jgi:hypothetical protein
VDDTLWGDQRRAQVAGQGKARSVKRAFSVGIGHLPPNQGPVSGRRATNGRPYPTSIDSATRNNSARE